VEESGGGIALPGADSPAAEPTLVAGITMQPLVPGGSFQNGAVTFLLSKAETGPNSTVLHWQVSGLPAGTPPTAGEFLLQLPDGSLFKALGAEGGATGQNDQIGESGEVTFPALPAGTKSFVLVVPNGWNGASETWLVPVALP
jgi:hypothetical protein